MDEQRNRAYRVVLFAGLLHLKWDLACLFGGFSWFNPWRALTQIRAACRAACRACALHNLAIFAANDFSGFVEDVFWNDIQRFQAANPDAICPYRNIFERCLRGDVVHIIAPSGVGIELSKPLTNA
jgi:hypothetical protein